MTSSASAVSTATPVTKLEPHEEFYNAVIKNKWSSALDIVESKKIDWDKVDKKVQHYALAMGLGGQTSSFNRRNSYGFSYSGSDFAAKLLEQKADVNSVNDQGDTQLHVFRGSKEVLETLMRAGLTKDVKNKAGHTAKELVEREALNYIRSLNPHACGDRHSSIVAAEMGNVGERLRMFDHPEIVKESRYNAVWGNTF